MERTQRSTTGDFPSQGLFSPGNLMYRTRPDDFVLWRRRRTHRTHHGGQGTAERRPSYALHPHVNLAGALISRL